MAFPQSSRAWADMRHPEPWGICDRCGFRYLRSVLRWQYDWRGNQLQNLRLLVCAPCEDVPNEQQRPIIIGPDPVPVRDPRPDHYATQALGGPEITANLEPILEG